MAGGQSTNFGMETLDASTPSKPDQPTVTVQPTGDKVITEAERTARRQDWVRAVMTSSFLVMLLIVIMFSCWAAQSWATHWNQTKELLQLLLPALTALVGSSTGFYFGTKSSNSNK